MLRKPLLLCLLTLLCLGSLAACGEAPASAEETTQTEPSQTQETEPSQSQEEAPSLTQLRADLQAGDYFCGIAFLRVTRRGSRSCSRKRDMPRPIPSWQTCPRRRL